MIRSSPVGRQQLQGMILSLLTHISNHWVFLVCIHTAESLGRSSSITEEDSELLWASGCSGRAGTQTQNMELCGFLQYVDMWKWSELMFSGGSVVILHDMTSQWKMCSITGVLDSQSQWWHSSSGQCRVVRTAELLPSSVFKGWFWFYWWGSGPTGTCSTSINYRHCSFCPNESSRGSGSLSEVQCWHVLWFHTPAT